MSATIKMFPLSMMSPTMARGLTIAPTEPHPTPSSFNSRHREKVFLCVSYPRRPMNKISTPSMAGRHQIEKFTPTPFQPFQPSVWTGRAGGILICRFHKILLSRLFACYRAPCSLCFRKKGAIICSNCVTCTMGLFE